MVRKELKMTQKQLKPIIDEANRKKRKRLGMIPLQLPLNQNEWTPAMFLVGSPFDMYMDHISGYNQSRIQLVDDKNKKNILLSIKDRTESEVLDSFRRNGAPIHVELEGISTRADLKGLQKALADSNYSEAATILIGGIHRWFAHQEHKVMKRIHSQVVHFGDDIERDWFSSRVNAFKDRKPRTVDDIKDHDCGNWMRRFDNASPAELLELKGRWPQAYEAFYNIKGRIDNGADAKDIRDPIKEWLNNHSGLDIKHKRTSHAVADKIFKSPLVNSSVKKVATYNSLTAMKAVVETIKHMQSAGFCPSELANWEPQGESDQDLIDSWGLCSGGVVLVEQTEIGYAGTAVTRKSQQLKEEYSVGGKLTTPVTLVVSHKSHGGKINVNSVNYERGKLFTTLNSLNGEIFAKTHPYFEFCLVLPQLNTEDENRNLVPTEEYGILLKSIFQNGRPEFQHPPQLQSSGGWKKKDAEKSFKDCKTP